MSHAGTDLAILIPLWRRTSHIQRVLSSAVDATPAARVVFIVSEGDTEVCDWLWVGHDRPVDFRGLRLTATRAGFVVLLPGDGGGTGDYAIKINAGYRATDEPYLFTGADDLAFHGGWYDAARKLMGPRPLTEVLAAGGETLGTVGVVGTVDLCNERTMDGTHSTHSLVARWYADCCAVIDQPGAIYHEGYEHEYCDDELCGYAMSKGAYAHSTGVVEHLHPLVGKSPDDMTYRRGRSMSRWSRRRFIYRRRMWQ